MVALLSDLTNRAESAVMQIQDWEREAADEGAVDHAALYECVAAMVVRAMTELAEATGELDREISG